MFSPVKIWRNQKKIASLLGKTGKIISWTYIRVPPEGFAHEAPYYVALVELSDKTRITAQVADCDDTEIRIGQPVMTVIRCVAQADPDSVIPYGIKVKIL